MIEQQRRLDKAAGRENPYLGMTFAEIRKIHQSGKNVKQPGTHQDNATR